MNDPPSFTEFWVKQNEMMQWAQRGGMLGQAGPPPGCCGTGQCPACRFVGSKLVPPPA